MNGVDTQILWDYHVVHPLGVILDPHLGPPSARPYGPWVPNCALQGSVPGAPPAAVDRRLGQLHSPGRTSTVDAPLCLTGNRRHAAHASCPRQLLRNL